MQRMVFSVLGAAALATITTLSPLSSSPVSARDRDDYTGAYNCVNPAGHVRGRCRHRITRNGSVAGRVLSIGGVLVQFARNNGRIMTVDQQALINAGPPLVPGRYYSLRGYWAPSGLFYATQITNWGY